MDELIPIYRIEFFLDAIVNNTTPPVPIYRAEFYLAKIAGADVEIPEPVYRMEKYLAYLCGEEVELPDPIYRIEYYLAFLCGLDVELPDPIYRVEFWLWDWCGGGGIEKTVTGNPIHITDALAKPAQALSVKLEPIQDLRGYDSPWPAGGGKNLLPLIDGTYSIGATGASASVSNGVVTVTGTTTASGGRTTRISEYFTLKAGTYIISPLTNDSPYVRVYLSKKADNSAVSYSGGNSFTLTEDTEVYCGLGVETGQTYNRTISPQVEAGSTITSYSPYSNICPISGHTDADVTRTGKNLLDKSNLLSGLFPFPSQMRIAPIGAEGASVYCPIKGGETYTVSKMRSARFTIATTSELPAQNVTINNYWNVSSNTTATVTTAETDKYLVVFFYLASADTGLTQDEILNTVQVELGSTATDYEEYRGTTYPIPLGTTVYGGTLDVLTGVLTVTMLAVDSGSLTWSYVNSIFVATLPSNSYKYSSSVKAISDCYAFVGAIQNGTADMQDKADCSLALYYNANYPTSRVVYVKDTAYTDAAAFKAAMNGHQLVYELATPMTIQLTPTQVELLQGENNIWSDGEMTLVYLADGNASDVEALNILLGGRYVNNHGEDEPTDREALDILLGGNTR